MKNKVVFIITSVLLFASCSQNYASSTKNQDSNSNSEIVQPVEEAKSAGTDSANTTMVEINLNGNTDDPDHTVHLVVPNTSIDPRDCYFNYISIFKWENANSLNAYDVAPILSIQKIATLKIYNGSQVSNSTLRSTLVYPSNSAWKYYFILSTNSDQGTTSVTSFLNKKDQRDVSTELTCGFGPTFDASNTITDPGARIVYQNVGVGLNSVDGQVGFLSHKDKFIACKISKGTQGVVFYGADTSTEVTHAFVVKRGCYQ